MQTVKIDRSKEWTVEDYLQLGETNTPCQLINGELIMSPSPTPLHQRVLRKLFRILDQHQSEGEFFFAPIDLHIDHKNVYQPDLLYVSNKEFITHRGIEGPPEIVVEIISPSNIFSDRNTKKKAYLEFGVTEYWIVDPGNQTLEIYLKDQSDPEVPTLYLATEGTITSTVLTNLQFNLKQIF